jgi:hypothetical protein
MSISVSRTATPSLALTKEEHLFLRGYVEEFKHVMPRTRRKWTEDFVAKFKTQFPHRHAQSGESLKIQIYQYLEHRIRGPRHRKAPISAARPLSTRKTVARAVVRYYAGKQMKSDPVYPSTVQKAGGFKEFNAWVQHYHTLSANSKKTWQLEADVAEPKSKPVPKWQIEQ